MIPWVYYQSELIQPLVELFQASEFRAGLEALGGYDIADMGKVVADFG